jgi:uncharacterized protein YkwD
MELMPGLEQIEPLLTGCTKELIEPVNDVFEQEVVYLTNLERQKAGLPPLKRNRDLDYSARYHAKDLADDRYLMHDTHDRNAQDNLIFVCGLKARIEKYFNFSGNLFAENFDGGHATPAQVVAFWMTNNNAKNIILDSKYREIGVGYYSGGPWGHYWVQNFGTRNNQYPLVIDLENAQTDEAQVDLSIASQEIFNQMRLKNDEETWGEWIPYSSNLTWTLRRLLGVRKVSVELKTSDQKVYPASDEITLTWIGPSSLGGLPAEISFLFNQSTGQYIYPEFLLQPQNSGNDNPLTWSAVPGAGWINLSQASGITQAGQSTVTINGLDTSQVGIYTSQITVTVTDPPGIPNSPAVVPVRVVVVPHLNYKAYLPLILR